MKSDEVQHHAVMKQAICCTNALVRSRLLEVGNCVDDSPKLWPQDLEIKDDLASRAVLLLQVVCNSPFLSGEVSWMKEMIFLFRFVHRIKMHGMTRIKMRDMALMRSFMLKLEIFYGAEEDLVDVAAALSDQGLLVLQSGNVGYARELFARSLEMNWRLLGENCDNKEVTVSLFQG